MQEQIVNFETAKLAKEKGFNISTHSYYFEDTEFKEHSLKGTNGYYGDEYEFCLSEFNENWNDKWLTKKSGDRCFGCSKQEGYLETFSAPTQSLLAKWLREVHDIDIFINKDSTFNKGTYCIFIYDNIKDIPRLRPLDNDVFSGYSTYEEAFEIGLQEGLKLIKTK